jgi:cell division protein FtsI (penicillin-binding protein 3)
MSGRILDRFESKIFLLKIAFAAIWFIFIGRLVWLQAIESDSFLEAAIRQQNLDIAIQAKRGTIYDRYYRVLAQDIDSYSYYIIPNNIKNKTRMAKILAEVIGENDWLNKFAHHPKFLWVARKTTPEIQLKLESAAIDSLNRAIEPRRVYPGGDLALALLGRVDIDNIGLSGLEKQYDQVLSGKNGKTNLVRDANGRSFQFSEEPMVKPVNGSSIVITVDLDLQQIAEQELAAALQENGAKAGVAIFEKVETGEVLACISLDSLGTPSRRNRAICDQYEPGSTFKLVAVATALASGRFTPATVLDVENGKFRVGDKIIRDDHNHDRLSVEDIVVYSSNIGAAKLGLAMGDDRIFKAIKEAGFTLPLGIDFPGEAAGQLNDLDWRVHYLANVSFGHGVAATPLQMLSLYGAVASGGGLYRPFIGKEIIFEDGHLEPLNHVQKVRNIFSPEIAGTIGNFLKQVVVRGTATKADSGVVTIAGKTGTALKLRDDNRGYDHRKARASFIGYFPAEMPQVVGIIIFDEPKVSRYGGEVSAPVFKKIAERYSVLPTKLPGMYICGGIIENRTKPEKTTQRPDSARVMMVQAHPDNFLPDHDAVPDFRGLTIRRAMVLAQKCGLKCEFSGSGIVIEQLPVAGELSQPGMIIKLRCTSG